MSMAESPTWLARGLLSLLRFYQRFFSTALALVSGSGCRFTPTCSEYAVQAIDLHGALRGSKMALLRVCRCHPFHPGGYDPPHR
ncbi:MAG TPA: membrane protein insertion efficiency factor YidD [Pseudomonadota bacterium]|jgi:putative membrane protein insertion efficiency factor|nr:membrane protein insertion efficiency factor YidD [Pseudomonadota bacterium]HNO68028.1 membrane protein insertion efficiency factor YidD [Pseudomonadota bacterium]